MVAGVRSVIRTVQSLKHYRNVGAIICWRGLFFNDGMTARADLRRHLCGEHLPLGPVADAVYGIELSVFAVLGGFFGGWLDDHLGSKRALFVSIGGTALAFAVG